MKPALSLLSIVLLLAGCSGSPSPATSTSPAPSSDVSSTLQVSAASSTPPTESPSPTPTPSFTVEELALLQADDWSLEDPNADSFIASAHDLCDTFEGLQDEDIFTALKSSTEEKRLTAGRIMLHLCNFDRFTPLVIAAELPGSVVSGTYYIGTETGELPPGKYKTIGAVQDCYWVRKDEAGNIVKNDNVKNAPGGVRITVQPSDYEVTMQRCGIWIPHE